MGLIEVFWPKDYAGPDDYVALFPLPKTSDDIYIAAGNTKSILSADLGEAWILKIWNPWYPP
ncbi:MAG: hypothetical protein ACUVWV_10610 [Thermodesulfobacteriota bacterium]